MSAENLPGQIAAAIRRAYDWGFDAGADGVPSDELEKNFDKFWDYEDRGNRDVVQLVREFVAPPAHDEGGLPVHLPVGVTEDGYGPTEPDEPHHRRCWCRDPECMWTVALAAERAAPPAQEAPSAVAEMRPEGLQAGVDAMVGELHELLDDCAQTGDEEGAVKVWAVRQVLRSHNLTTEDYEAALAANPVAAARLEELAAQEDAEIEALRLDRQRLETMTGAYHRVSRELAELRGSAAQEAPLRAAVEVLDQRLIRNLGQVIEDVKDFLRFKDDSSLDSRDETARVVEQWWRGYLASDDRDTYRMDVDFTTWSRAVLDQTDTKEQS